MADRHPPVQDWATDFDHTDPAWAADRTLDKLPSIYADVMRLVRDGFTHPEIAGRLGIPTGTVKSRMAKAAGTLRSELAACEVAAMLSEREIELAHPDAFDFAFGNLPEVKQGEFTRHLGWCPHCQKVLDEYSDIGQIIKILPPHAGPSAEPGERTVAAMATALAGQPDRSDRRPDTQDRTAAAVHQIPQGPPPPEEPAPTRIVPIPPAPPQLAHQEPPAGTGARIIRFPRWHGHARLLAAAGAVAAAIITAAIVILPRLGGSPTAGGTTFALHSPTGQAASGVATDRPDASGSWDLTLSVAHLKNPGETHVYQCWYVGPGQPGHQKLVSAGTLVAGNDGSGTFSMTSGADPHDFRTIEITIDPLGHTGQPGPVVLTGTAHLT